MLHQFADALIAQGQQFDEALAASSSEHFVCHPDLTGAVQFAHPLDDLHHQLFGFLETAGEVRALKADAAERFSGGSAAGDDKLVATNAQLFHAIDQGVDWDAGLLRHIGELLEAFDAQARAPGLIADLGNTAHGLLKFSGDAAQGTEGRKNACSPPTRG